MNHKLHGIIKAVIDMGVPAATIVLSLLIVLAGLVIPAFCKNTYQNFFAGTDHELNVYRINGKMPGATILIIGGIQGDEPGGFLSADLYADMRLEKGNLIVVPRANFYSILLNRRLVNEDMNRKFTETSELNFETQVVTILKDLIAESDCLLNLHDGSGFYSETWESEQRNPLRFGQSIIADCEEYHDPKSGTVIKLGEMARNIAEVINKSIDNPEIFFSFNNHRTNEQTTLHAEQRKSATYYALFTCGIPAFGIETSKALPIETRINHHKLAVNAFMKIFDITPEVPGMTVEKPIVKYIVARVNDQAPIVIGDGETLNIVPGDTVKITHVEGNYERGYTVDIEEHGSINDVNKPFSITKPTRVIVRKDNNICGNISIFLKGTNKSIHTITKSPRVVYFKCRINRKEYHFPNGAHVDILKGDQIELVDVYTIPESCPGVVVNLKGYVPPGPVNTGEDRGWIVDTEKDLWKRYSLYNKGRIYQVVVLKDDKHVIGRLFFDMNEPSFHYIVFQLNDGIKRCFLPDDTISIQQDESIKLIDVKTNVPYNFNVSTSLTGSDFSVPFGIGSEIDGKNIQQKGNSCDIVISRGSLKMGRLSLNVTSEGLACSDQNIRQ
ncbi:MAG TPA: hypothetical protein ENO00_11675 [Deltaproteobacteria bacterium]|nr:hypothetical protein [Deltaproteobacteria bacterium]